MKPILLNLGCGSVRPKGWINTDSSINANLQRVPFIRNIVPSIFKTVQYSSYNFQYMNLNRTWNYKTDSVEVVYASHLFEHLSIKSADLFLREGFRCLKSNGTIRIVVPDLYKISKKYVTEYESGDTKAWEYMMWAINMHREGQYPNTSFFKKILFSLQGYPHQHKYMYDEYSLREKFEQIGFRDIQSLSYGVSNYISNIKDVEGDKEHYLSVYLEAKK